MDNVVILPCVTRLDIPPDRILDAALKEKMSEVVVIGYDENHNFYFGSSNAKIADVLLVIEMAKAELMAMIE